MNKLNKPLILAFLLAFFGVTQAFSQIVPGYMGKKFMIRGEAYVNPYPLKGYSTYWVEKPVVAMPDMRFNFEVDYVVSHNVSLGINYELFRTSNRIPRDGDNGSPHIGVQGNGIGIFAKFFKYGKRGHLAPVGSYIKLGHIVQFNRLYDLNGKLLLVEKPTYFRTVPNFVTHFGMGHNHVLGKSIMLNYGFQTGLAIAYIPSTIFGIGGDFAAETNRRTLFMYLLSVNVGIGGLLF